MIINHDTMKIELKSSNPITKYYLKNLNDEKIDFKLGDEVSLPIGWYELNIEYSGEKTDINEIIVNDESIEHLMYSGWYTDGAGRKHQPGMTLWDNGGRFKIWLHTDVGVFRERLLRSIRNGDFGTDLSLNYQFTCDKPLNINPNFPQNLKSFFRAWDGPNWWHKKSNLLPYQYAPNIDLDKNKIIEECTNLCVHKRSKVTDSGNGWELMYSDQKLVFELPFVSIDKQKFPNIKRLMDTIGMEEALNVVFYSLEPGGYIDEHVDDNAYNRKGYRYLKGCRTFYWSLTDPGDVFFKFGRCGLIPLDRPLFINPVSHVHGVVNQGQNKRLVISIAGKYRNED
jgi:hypothetical protein